MFVPSRRRDEHGAEAVEFALVVSLLLLLVFGIIVYGMIFAQQLSLGNGARQGARFGAVDGRTCADIVAEAKNNATTIGISASDVTVTVTRGATTCSGGTTKPCASSAPNDSVKVTATITPKSIVPLVPIPSSLKGVGEFRCEFS